MADNLDPELIRQLNENLQQLNTVLPNLAKTAGAAGATIKSAGTNAATGLGNVATSAASVTKAEEIRAEQEKKYAEAMANFSRSLNSATDSVKGLGKALLSTTQGFTKYGGALDSAGDAAFSLGKNFGILGMALGGAVKAFTMVAKAGLEQADNTLKAVDDMTKFGAAGQFTADRFLSLAHEVGLTSKNLNLLTKPLASMGAALTSLGADAGKGAEAFTQMATISKEERMRYSRLGVSQEELLQNQADYVSLQRASGMQITEQMKRDGSLRKASLEYTDNLLELAAITGKNVDTVKAEQAAALSREETLIQTNIQQREINRLRASGTEEDKARAKVLEDELKARNDLLATVKTQTGSEKLTDAVANFFATGAINEQNAFLTRMGIPLEEFKERMARGEDVTSDFMNALKKAGDETVDSVGAAGMLSKEVREAFGLEKEFLQFLAGRRDIDEKGARDAAAAKIKAAGEEGQDTSKDIRATLQETERTIQIGLDKVVQEFNPLMKGFGLATAAAGALAAAAGAAAIALGKIAAVGALGGNIKGDSRDALKDKGKVTQGKDGRYRDDKGRFTKPPEPEPAKGAFGKADGALGKTLGILGKVAGPVGALVGVVSSASDAVEGLEKVEKEKQEGKITAKEATVKKSEVVGEGVGGAAGGVGGALAGAAAGAAIGSVVPIIGTAIGGILGAALGGMGGQLFGGMAGKSLGGLAGNDLAKMKKSVNLDTKDLGLPEMPLMAKGGITKGPTIAGEAGPEAVIPLSENRTVPVDITGLNNEKLLTEISNLSGMIKSLKTDDHIESIQELTHELLSEKEKELKISTDLSKSFIDVDKVLGNVLVSFNKFNTQLQDVNKEIENVEDKESRFADIIDSSTNEYSKAIKKLSDGMGIKVPEKPSTGIGLKAETTTATKGMEGALGTGLTIPKGQQQEKLFEALKAQGITGGAAQANILAQVQAESGFKSRSENLNYSGKKLFELYGAGNKGGNKVRFQSLEEAEQLAAQGPEAIGNLIYGGRMGNAADEGFKYRGRGLIQLTGKANYEKFGKLLGIDLVENPDLANDPDVAAQIAAAYFKEKEKRGVDLTDIAAVGKAVGYAGGQEETARRAQLAQAFMKESGTPQAMDGGIFKGPNTGYPVMLHGEELVAPMNSLLKKLMETPAESATVASAPAPIETDNSRNEAINMEMISMLAEKLDTMITKLDDSNSIQDKILRYSQV